MRVSKFSTHTISRYPEVLSDMSIVQQRFSPERSGKRIAIVSVLGRRSASGVSLVMMNVSKSVNVAASAK
jgi:hypothetical protein